MNPSRTEATGVLATDGGGDLVVRRVRVRVVSGPDSGREALLEGGTLVVGSHPDVDLQVRDPTVSRYHAELGLVSTGVRVRDLQSTNGTFVGATRVESIVVPVGTEIRLGRARLQLVAADAPAPLAPSEATRFGRLVGTSPAMRRVFALLERVAPTDTPVLLEGEQGTGKSEAARAIHDASPRAGRPCWVLDVGAPLEPRGVHAAFEAAQSGTLIVDRVDEASATTASTLLSLLDRRERGELDVRTIATSRSDLRQRVERGAMPRALYFHLAAVRIVLPPLRERREDLLPLVREVVAGLGYEGLPLGPEDLALLRVHDFPGNVRELVRLVERTLVASRPGATTTTGSGGSPAFGGVTDELSALPFKDAKERLVDAFEADYVRRLLERHRGNFSRAAAEAGLDRNYLARLARKHGLVD
ncbi:MAG: sigma 54-interacting transcriptional regulator [Myxococcota bacterium]|nr:sigma 54-interacting transcriptional regulator [Myxococcota bacterium]MDW8362018.1 sigma 54-interacting transcriptional regulator [Myxococcales bacterium]